MCVCDIRVDVPLCRVAVDCDSAHGQASIARQNKNKIHRRRAQRKTIFSLCCPSHLFSYFYSLFSISNMELTWRPSTFLPSFFHNIYASSAVCSIYTAAYVLTPLFSPPLFSSHTRQFNGKRRRKNIHEKELITIRKVGKQDTAISFIMLYYYTRWMDGWII